MSMTSAFKLMRLKLGQTFFNVGSIMMSNPHSPSLDNIKHVLSAYDETIRTQVAQCQNIRDVLELIFESCPLDDMSMLVYFVDTFNIDEAKPVIEEYKNAIEEFRKRQLSQFLKEQFLNASPLECETITIVVVEDATESIILDVAKLSSAIFEDFALQHLRFNVIRDGIDTTNTVDKTSQTRDKNDAILTAKLSESVNQSFQEEGESNKKQWDQEKEYYETEKQFYKQVIKKCEEEIAALTQQHEEVTSLLEQTQIKADELQLEYVFTQDYINKLEKEVLEFSSLMKQKAVLEKAELQTKIDSLQQKLELYLVQDNKDVSVQCDYSVPQSELQSEPQIKTLESENETFQKQRNALLHENEKLKSLLKVKNALLQLKDTSEILQEKENVHACTFIKKDKISKLSVILEPVEDDWYYIGQCLEVKESVLTEIKEMTPVDSRLTYVLESWCHEEKRTIEELEEPLREMGRDDILQALREFANAELTVNNSETHTDAKGSNEIETRTETEDKEIQATQSTLDKEMQFNYLVPSQDNLEGLSESQIAGKKLFLVQGGKPQLMNWEEYGLRISVPEDSLSASETVEVSVLALVGGHFKFPDNTRLVSAVYAISTSPLLKSLRIEMQHCIDLSDPSLCKYLKFAVAPVHTASLPYQFSIIEGGEFPPYKRYGYIERSKFCQLAIVGNEGENNEEGNEQEDGDSDESGDEGGKEKKQATRREGEGAGKQEEEPGGVGRSERQEEGNSLKEPLACTEESELSSQSKTIVFTCSTSSTPGSTGVPEATVYAGQVFFEQEESRDLMTFTAARDLNSLRQFIKKEYSHPEIDQSITFKLKSPKRHIKLKFDEQQARPTTGWQIIPHLVPCQIREQEILGFGDISTTIPPSCLVSIYAENSPDTVPILRYSVPLEGVQEPMEININRSLRIKSSSPSLPVSAVPVVVTDDTNLGWCAQNALKKQHDKLKSLLSRSEPIFRDIAGACKAATIIHFTEYDKIFDDKTGQSLLERADHFINCIISVVDVCPDQLEVFLNIVMNKGNIAFVRVAELITQCFNSEVPEHACIKLAKQ
ncbi:PREDICTED: uncharacterized protein LOC109585748 isoform X1 [Amphimedon queenslandica]|uniref:Death domain-containing protein n=2 Tax=Amphimedon queenslandica TaxID=400682 RepID=A0AAN0JK95_AMPQE|nr:PREDICTED: uncharacterized protein LOC109585748 isoform X1 [Amphimedon queenslandica]|eukprot:XP_019857432.1 PREDICTED: uncharacterized protein LOC109585748 isoform X1 [Amphimedon queenslandica]